ncbi:MAG: hypothetical protein IJG13_24545 [Kiritimatiellae bacterium]|nr:hypothetical protein [Kiritimatiellia bacterium]MBQ3343200.1 hypothetical protein [Kiritimatiellia bacterium]
MSWSARSCRRATSCAASRRARRATPCESTTASFCGFPSEPTREILAGGGMKLVAHIDGRDVEVEGRDFSFEGPENPAHRGFSSAFSAGGFAGSVRGGEATFVVCDYTDAGGVFRVRPDVAALGLPPGFRAYDMEDGSEVPVADGEVSVSVNPSDFRMVVLK